MTTIITISTKKLQHQTKSKTREQQTGENIRMEGLQGLPRAPAGPSSINTVEAKTFISFFIILCYIYVCSNCILLNFMKKLADEKNEIILQIHQSLHFHCQQQFGLK